MAAPEHKLRFREKTGYALGDAAANLVWRGVLAFLAVFYTDTFGLSAASVGVLLLIVRLSDGITDFFMGMIADRTHSRWGKFRPWVLFSAPVLALFMVLTFSTPDFGPTGKLIWAYITYIGLTLAYTANNVPYSALMGVMTPSTVERTNLSAFRFAGAFLGGFLVMSGTPLLVDWFGGGNDQLGYRYTSYLFAVLLVAMLAVTFFSTKERVVPARELSGNFKQELWDLTINIPYLVIPLTAISLFFYYRNLPSGLFFLLTMVATAFAVKKIMGKPKGAISGTQQDLIDLLKNVPWMVLTVVGLLAGMFNGIKTGVTAYYFNHYIGDHIDLSAFLGWLPGGLASREGMLLSVFFAVILLVSVAGALCTGVLSRMVGKKNLFVISLFASGLLLCPIFYLKPDQVYWLFGLAIAAEFFGAIVPALVFSMLGDSADYSEWKNGRRATGLVYSAGSLIGKAGGGFAGALMMLVLAAYGYDGADKATIANALDGMRALMSWIPSIFIFAAGGVMLFYPLGDRKMEQIERELAERREPSLS